MTKQRKPQQTVAAAEAVLRDLEAKRDKLLAFGQQLTEARRAHAYQAHAADDPDARRELDNVIAAAATNDGVLTSVQEAISEAETKLAVARAYEADVADQAKARAILELLGAFRECGREMDDAARTLGETGKVLTGLLSQLHAAGVHSPSLQQFDVLGDQALKTAILGTPWGKRYPLLAPHERRMFGDLIDGWATMIESRIRAQLGEQEEEIAA
jgi:hypothetical protein